MRESVVSELLIRTKELQAALGQPGWLIIDVRHDLIDHAAGRQAYEQGHIPGARFLDQETQLSAKKSGLNGRHPLPDMAEFEGVMRGIGLQPATQVVVYDSSGGMFATRLWWMLRWMGHEKVSVLDGGWPAWLKSGAPVETGNDQNKVAVFGDAENTPPSPAMPTVNADQVLANIPLQHLTVIDARANNRFTGEVEPMDPVAGHIPGALNRPHSCNMTEDGYFKSASKLRDEFSQLLQGKAPQTVVHQCGSGITATHNLFAMELAGLHGSALYPGSWSEWCSDPSRPVARGDDSLTLDP